MKQLFVRCTGLILSLVVAHAGAEPTVEFTETLGPFTGEGAKMHPDNLSPHKAEYYGTDLGFSYEHGGRIHFLFGDTWAVESYAPIEKSTGSKFDDMYGTIELAEWPDPEKITRNNIPLIKLGQIHGTTEVDAMDPGHAMDLGKTPMAGFSNGEGQYAIFNITKPRGCLKDSD